MRGRCRGLGRYRGSGETMSHAPAVCQWLGCKFVTSEEPLLFTHVLLHADGKGSPFRCKWSHCPGAVELLSRDEWVEHVKSHVLGPHLISPHGDSASAKDVLPLSKVSRARGASKAQVPNPRHLKVDIRDPPALASYSDRHESLLMQEVALAYLTYEYGFLHDQLSYVSMENQALAQECELADLKLCRLRTERDLLLDEIVCHIDAESAASL